MYIVHPIYCPPYKVCTTKYVVLTTHVCNPGYIHMYIHTYICTYIDTSQLTNIN